MDLYLLLVPSHLPKALGLRILAPIQTHTKEDTDVIAHTLLPTVTAKIDIAKSSPY